MSKIKLRSQNWFNNPDNPGMTALYIERYLNFGLTRKELQSGKPIIGIAQSGSDLSPCNRHFLKLSERIRAGIRDSGGIPMEFPTHPIQETGKRPTAALDRNLAYLSLVEVLYGYPLDGVVLTTGCDKTTPASLMAAATVNIPAIVLSGGPMLDGNYKGKKVGSGTIIWEGRRMFARGEINYEEFMEMVSASAPSVGHCNTMGTATSMNSLAEALGMSLTGCAAIPAPYRERAQMAYDTGLRSVQLVEKDIKPSDIMTREAFQNAIVTASAIGASTNAPPHIIAIAKHLNINLTLDDWEKWGEEIPLLVNLQPAGDHLGEGFFQAGGVPVVMKELSKQNKINNGAMTVTGKTVADNLANIKKTENEIIKNYEAPMKDKAGFLVLRSNFFDTAIMKMSVVSEEFKKKYLSDSEHPMQFTARAIVFDGPEHYHNEINNPELNIDENCILIIRGCGPIGYPGSAEVVNMQPPDHLLKKGISALPCLGDGRQSGTSESASILNVSPEAAAGGKIVIIQNDDLVKVDLIEKRVDVMIDQSIIDERMQKIQFKFPANQTPWQEIARNYVGQLSDGACLNTKEEYFDVSKTKGVPRDNH
jgi:dihydroxy-acid dehydratase